MYRPGPKSKRLGPKSSTPVPQSGSSHRKLVPKRAINMSEYRETSPSDVMSIDSVSSLWSGNSSQVYDIVPPRKKNRRILADNDIISNQQPEPIDREPDDGNSCSSPSSRISEQSRYTGGKQTRRNESASIRSPVSVPKRAEQSTATGRRQARMNESASIRPSVSVHERAEQSVSKDGSQARRNESASIRSPVSVPARGEQSTTTRRRQTRGNESASIRSPVSVHERAEQSTTTGGRQAKRNESASVRSPVSVPERAEQSTSTGGKQTRRNETASARNHVSVPNRTKRKELKPSQRKKKGIGRTDDDIMQLQRSTDHLIPRVCFQRVVREVAVNITGKSDYKFSLLSLQALQESAEAYIVGLFEDAYLLTIHAKRKTLYIQDMKLARRIRGD